jgi:Mrp family chromosome partitioning ATPase/capsular polysaccharide biosynthesis protein
MNIEVPEMLRTGPIAHNRYEISDDQFGLTNQDPLNVETILQFLRRSWRRCALWAVIGLCAGLAFALTSRSYYTSYATLLLEDRALRPFPETAAAPEPVDASYPDSQIQVIQSNEVIGRVVDEYDLTNDAEFGRGVRGLRATLAEKLPFLSPILVRGGSEPTRQAVQHLTIIRVKDALSVTRIGVSNAVEIGFTSQDPDRAAAISNAIAKAYIDSRLDLKRRARDEAISQLRDRLNEARERAFSPGQPSQDRTARAPDPGSDPRERFREQQNTTETYRGLYNNFLQRYTEAVQQVPFAGARVITQAEPPLERSWPSIFIALALGGLGGAAIGFGRSLWRQVTDRSIQTCGDLQRTTGLDCIAEIRRVKERQWKKTDHKVEDLQEAYLRDSATVSDAMAKAAVYLQSTRMNSSGSLIGITALKEGGGASSIAAHLARTFARSGQKTLLIDANWRAPVPQGGHPDPAQDRSIFHKLVSTSVGAETLDVLVFRGSHAITDLNASQAISGALLRVQGEYACVVVDFHSLDKTADVAASISLLNDLIIVTEAQKTPPERLWNALRSLPREKISIILNKVRDR